MKNRTIEFDGTVVVDNGLFDQQIQKRNLDTLQNPH